MDQTGSETVDHNARASLGAGGALTLNVGLYQEGWMGKETVAQLARMWARLVV